MSPTDLQSEVQSIRWFHKIDFGGGIITPGVDNSARKLNRLHLPESLRGQTVLDVGAWDGFFSFEAERRGAARVLATDSFVWSGKTWGSKRGFDLAKRVLGSNVEERLIDVMELSPESVGTFDVTLFLGVLYHLRHPLLALERVASVTGRLLIVETLVDLLNVRRPALAFYEKGELDGDPSNWFGPNPAAVVAMLRAAGFARAEIKAPPRNLLTRGARAAHLRLRRGLNFRTSFRTERIVVHAWK